jgi:uncharacterized protein YbjT (DUF2867 family)
VLLRFFFAYRLPPQQVGWLLSDYRSALQAQQPDLEHDEGDLDDTDALRRALAGCAAVHVSVRGGPTAEQYERVEHHGTARVAELAGGARVGCRR